MSTKLLDLEDRIVSDTGEVFFKDAFFLEKARSIEPFRELVSCEKSRDLLLLNKRAEDESQRVQFWDDNGEVTGPPEESYEWTIPEEYQKLDVREQVQNALVDKCLFGDDYYVERTVAELKEAEERGMFPFIRCLSYIRDKFRENNVVWGVGRGSSCACLIFFLLDINRVDPVLYDISMEEFFKPEKIID